MGVAGTERRLSATRRRAQLVDVAYAWMREHPLDALSPDAVAAGAGVSKPLVFHYFPTIGDLQLAVFDQVAESLVARLDASSDVALPDRLRAGIEAFIDAADKHAEMYLHVMRGGATDEKLRRAMHATRDRLARLIGAWVGVESPPPALLVVLRGYLGLIEEAVLEWLPQRPVPREALVAFLVGAAEQMPQQAAALLGGE